MRLQTIFPLLLIFQSLIRIPLTQHHKMTYVSCLSFSAMVRSSRCSFAATTDHHRGRKCRPLWIGNRAISVDGTRISFLFPLIFWSGRACCLEQAVILDDCSPRYRELPLEPRFVSVEAILLGLMCSISLWDFVVS